MAEHEEVERETLEFLSSVFRQRLAISFNGGKDCTALLYLCLDAMAMMGVTSKLTMMYIEPFDEFDEVRSFVYEISSRYPNKTALYHWKGDLKIGVCRFLQDCKSMGKEIVGIFLGNRRTDPNSSDLLPIQDTDGDWPRFLRIHPLLSWSYSQVWSYLRANPNRLYCNLYDQGYTSLGDRRSTRVNPRLISSTTGIATPAYALLDERSERDGRIAK